jgi:hypothetical protein
MIEAEETRTMVLKFNKFFWLELRKILWKHGLSGQEFFSYLIRLLATGDQRMHDLLIEAKRTRAKNEALNIVHTDEESLYSLIEQGLERKEK